MEPTVDTVDTDGDTIPLSLYIHFPWCVKKCPYCDFNSHTFAGELPEQRYIDSLKTDFDTDVRQLNPGRRLHSIFLGGGTPSLFRGESIAALLEFIGQRIEFEPDMEITLEANPGALEYDRLETWLEAGVNRLSIGVQSFNNRHLAALGRIHHSDEAERTVTQARRAGFNNLNLDIMFGLPAQTLAMALDDCVRAIAHSPEHLSFYQLTLEPNTWFHRHPPVLPDEDLCANMQDAIANQLDENGYTRYEVSAYARPGRQCVHNLNYWQFGDYLGIGAGAHSKVTDSDGVTRSWKQKRPETWMSSVHAGKPYCYPARVERDDILFECLLNALRIKKGIDVNMFERRTGLRLDAVTEPLDDPIAQGLLQISGNRIQCTEKGYPFIDEILQQLLA